jgi:pimeloyl-ACP methyl ester carboxylesterase
MGLVTLNSNAFAIGFQDFFFQRAQFQKQLLLDQLATPAGDKIVQDDTWFDQKLDHTSAEDMRTFKQRYWVNSTYAHGPNSPVIFYICGEATCSAEEMNGQALDQAQALGGYAVTLEHRYYGKSQPFDSLTTENLRYLTIENALEDLAAFENFAKTKLGLSGKWISIGGSYAGALSAYYHTQYPTLTEGALSSSGPVQALENFEEYDRHVFEVAGTACAAAIRNVVKQAEAQVDNPTQFAAVKKGFAADAISDPDDFLYILADTAASAVQYGFKDQFCNAITAPATDAAKLQAYGAFAQKVYAMWGVDALGFSVESAENLDPNSYISGVGQRQWMYQSCTQFGFFQNAYHDPAYSVRSPRINPTYHRNLCKRLFGIDQAVDAAGTNARYYQPVLTQSSNILFTNGSTDPWSLLGINPTLGNNTNPNDTVVLIDGASHCSDLASLSLSDSAPLSAAKQKFSDMVSLWLKL